MGHPREKMLPGGQKWVLSLAWNLIACKAQALPNLVALTVTPLHPAPVPVSSPADKQCFLLHPHHSLLTELNGSQQAGDSQCVPRVSSGAF